MNTRSIIMSPKKCVTGLLVLQVMARMSFVKSVIGMPEPEYSNDLLEALVNIVRSCHGTEINTVGIVGSPPDSLVASLMSEGPYAVVLMDGKTKSKDRDPQSDVPRNKLQVFVIETRSKAKLNRTLANVKSTRWWNHMANFYIVDWSFDGNGCEKASGYLWKAWRANILQATFICVDETNLIMLYTFNPYTRDAPDPWRLERVYRGKNNHPWSLLVREYSKDRDTCKDVNFDKTKDLGGHEIVASIRESPIIRISPNKTGIEAVETLEGKFFASMFKSLNASVKLLVHDSSSPGGYIYKNGTVDGTVAEVHNGSSDISLVPTPLWKKSGLTWTYPHYATGVSVMTQYRGSKSQMEKLLDVFDRTSTIGLCAVCFLTFAFFKFALRQTPTIAFLNTLRLICNSCLSKLPSRISPRIYLGILLLFVVTIQGIYQGMLASLLAKRVPLPDIDTIEDLAESSHRIYGRVKYRAIFDSPEFQGRFFPTERSNCTELVLKDSSAACVRSTNHLLVDAARFKLHLSEKQLVEYYLTWVIREDWPLENRINTMIQWSIEAGTISYSYEKYRERSWWQLQVHSNENRDRTSKILSFKDLEFAFVLLGIGLMVSAVVFIVELCIAQDAFFKFCKYLFL